MKSLTRILVLAALGSMPAFSQADLPVEGPVGMQAESFLAEEGPAPAPGARAARAAEHVSKALNLKEDQKARIKAIRGKYMEDMRLKREAAREATLAFRQAASNQDTPEDKLRGLHRAMGERRCDLMLAHRAMQSEVRAVLTPEQRERAAYIKGRIQGRHLGMVQGRKMAGPRAFER